MKKMLFLVIFLGSVFLYANPNDSIQECISWFGKNEKQLIEIGALQRGEDIDLRQYGLHLLRHFIWVKGNIGYWAQTSDGIVVSTRCKFPVSGIEFDKDGDPGQIEGKYKSKKDFDTDSEFIRQMVYANNGRLISTRETRGYRTISYEYFIGNFKISPSVFVYLEDAEKYGYGSIDIDVKLIK